MKSKKDLMEEIKKVQKEIHKIERENIKKIEKILPKIKTKELELWLNDLNLELYHLQNN